MFIVVACVLVCLFAFQAKVSQYQAIQAPLTNVYSNQMWFSVDDESSSATLLTAIPVLLLALGSVLLIFRYAGRVPIQTGVTYSKDDTWISPIRVLAPSLFRRPPPIA